MVNKVALDTNIVIDIFNNKKELLQLLRNYQEIYLPVIVCGELLFGAKNSSKRLENERQFRGFIGTCLVLNLNEGVAESYADIRKNLKDKGKPIPENDIWIAAICLVNDLPLVTNDRHFKEVEGLKLIEL